MQLRIGISSGLVVAGVIGRRRLTRDLLGDAYVTEPLGLVDVKRKGEVETWRLVEANALTSYDHGA